MVTLYDLYRPHDAWRAQAICRRLTKAEKACFYSTDFIEQDFAKAICRQCPAQQPCLDWANTNHETGIWGATTERDRNGTSRRFRIPPTKETR
jgi:WhiB family redox-sensing transcriptional regulator